jgi:hypothetical protein
MLRRTYRGSHAGQREHGSLNHALAAMVAVSSRRRAALRLALPRAWRMPLTGARGGRLGCRALLLDLLARGGDRSRGFVITSMHLPAQLSCLGLQLRCMRAIAAEDGLAERCQPVSSRRVQALLSPARGDQCAHRARPSRRRDARRPRSEERSRGRRQRLVPQRGIRLPADGEEEERHRYEGQSHQDEPPNPLVVGEERQRDACGECTERAQQKQCKQGGVSSHRVMDGDRRPDRRLGRGLAAHNPAAAMRADSRLLSGSCGTTRWAGSMVGFGHAWSVPRKAETMHLIPLAWRAARFGEEAE